MSDNDGATPEEQLLFACRTDNLDLFQTLITSEENPQLNVNTTDRFGMTPLHICVLYQSTEVLPLLLEEEVDVDLREKGKGDTPLHVAMRIEDSDNEEMRNWLVEQLLSAGADPKVRNSANEKPEDLLLGSAKESEKGQEVRRMLRDAEAENTFASKGDVVDEDAEPSDDEPPSDED
ncbi:ankyrin [Microstroma glucosiphilum]|uniref:Ankyrin n=1 Tax=Pseudomicrostroma glucosiphilum TaxID=1684307 RepID=A0A316UEG6_9BASI|nr:ankyrin [Pseudomicrostroma glucosiphilum]PWN23284.1 ankyrin [Pseudomicrostroma glucosiphilum]